MEILKELVLEERKIVFTFSVVREPLQKLEELCGYGRHGMPSSPEQRVVQRLDLIREVSLCAGW